MAGEQIKFRDFSWTWVGSLENLRTLMVFEDPYEPCSHIIIELRSLVVRIWVELNSPNPPIIFTMRYDVIWHDTIYVSIKKAVLSKLQCPWIWFGSNKDITKNKHRYTLNLVAYLGFRWNIIFSNSHNFFVWNMNKLRSCSFENVQNFTITSREVIITRSADDYFQLGYRKLYNHLWCSAKNLYKLFWTQWWATVRWVLQTKF